MMTPRSAILEFQNGQRAILTVAGWRVDPRDDVLSELLNSEFGLVETQRMRETLAPDLLATCARRAAGALNAEIIAYDPVPTLVRA